MVKFIVNLIWSLFGAPSKKATAKKTPAKKAPSKKATAKKAPAKKAPAKKATAKKTQTKKATAKKAPAKKAPAKKATAKKAQTKKATAKKAPAKKAPAKKVYPFGAAPYGSNQWYNDLRAICASHIKKNILRKIGSSGVENFSTPEELKTGGTNPAQIMEIFLKDGIEDGFQTTLETILRQGREGILDYAGKKENLFQVMGFAWNQFKMHLGRNSAQKRNRGLAPVSIDQVALVGNCTRPEQDEVIFADLISSLTEEERALAKALSEGKTFQEIGDALGISKQAAHKRVAKLRAKFTRSSEGGLKEKFLKADLEKGRVSRKYSKDVDGVWRSAYVPQIPVGEPLDIPEVPIVGSRGIM